MRTKSFKLLCSSLFVIGLSALFLVYQFGLVDMGALSSFDRGGKSSVEIDSDTVNSVGSLRVLDTVASTDNKAQLASAEPDAAVVQTAAIREAAAMMAGPPCDVVDCAATGMPFTVQASTPNCAGLIQEAETGLLSGFTIGTDGAASNGQYVQAPSSVGVQLTPNSSYKVSYCFSVSQAGTYRIKTNVYAATTSNDSFHVQVNGVPSAGYLWDFPANTSYLSDYVADRGGADPVEVTLAAGDHIIDVFMRERAARLDTIELEEVQPTGSCGGLVQEAEDGTITGFTLGTDAAASNGQYVQSPTSVGVQLTPNSAYKASYCFSVSQAGTYRIKTNVYAATTSNDSFHVQVNGVPSAGYLWDFPANTSYLSDYVADRGGADPVEVTLTAGDHTIDVFMRERAARLDTIELEEVVPTGGCGGLVQEAEDGTITGFILGADAAASNGQYVQAPTSVGVQLTPNSAYKASYCFSVSQAGTYRIKTNVYAANVNQDSFHVQVDGLPASGYIWDTLVNTTYLVDYVADRGGANPLEVTLTAGDHTVDVFMRERGTRLDTIALEDAQVLAAASISSVQTNAPDEHASVSGNIRVDYADGMLGNQPEVDFATFKIRIVDSLTNGQQYSEVVSADHHGFYFAEGLPSGRYTVALDLPNGYDSLMPTSVTVDVNRGGSVRIPFDLLVASASKNSSNSSNSVPRLYLPLIE